MEVFLALDIPPFVMYCVNGKPRSSLFIESTDSMIIIIIYTTKYNFNYHHQYYNFIIIVMYKDNYL